MYVCRNDARMIDEPTVQTRLSSPSREAKYIQQRRSSWRKKILNQVNGGSWVVANPSTPRPTHQHSRVSRYCCCYLTRNRQRNCERLICLAYFYLLAYADALDALRIRFPLVERPLLINSPTSATRSILSHSFWEFYFVGSSFFSSLSSFLSILP